MTNTKTAQFTADLAKELGLDYDEDSHHDSIYAYLGSFDRISNHNEVIKTASKKLEAANIKHSIDLSNNDHHFIKVEIYCGLPGCEIV